MKINLKLLLTILGAVLAPLAAFGACFFTFKLGVISSSLIAAACAAGAAFLAAALIGKGLVGPMELVAVSVKRFIAADYKLETAIPREGWPAAGGLISSLNRLMLELSAYRAFQLNQVMEERGKAQALVETITDGVLLVDHTGAIISCNRTALGLLGIQKLSPEVSIPGSVACPHFAAAIKEIMASSEKHFKALVSLPRCTGASSQPRIFQAISTQFLLATLKRPGRVIVLRDVTIEKELEKTKETFFQMITHDMRGPLSSIMGYTQFLRKMVPEGKASDNCMQTILRASARLNGMIEDILTTTKLERGDMTLQAAKMEAGDLLEKVRAAHAPEAERKKVSLTSLPTAEKLEFTGDPALLERVITNLMGNSLKFTPAGGSITLACADEGGSVAFSVTDTGPGIPEDKLKMVFEKYAQMEEHKSLGFGLGLAMCKMAVELHKGRIWVESEVGKGSKFIFTIPKTLPVSAPAKTPA